jgi:probable rRNA maturation factor
VKRRPRLNLEFQCATRATGVPPEADFRRWAEAALQGDCSVTLRVVGRPEGRALNLGYRGRDYATNVLTFVYETTPACLGDLALCAPVVKVEARRQGKPVQAHWAHLTVHGMLHLQGWDHEEDAAEAARMEALETQILRELGYPDPYLMAA